MEIADGKVKELWVNAPAENARVRMREISKQLATLYKEFYEYKGAGNNTKANESHYKIKQLEKEFDKMKDTMEQLKLMGLVTDNDATENGALEGNIGSNKETESMPLEKDPVQAQDAKFKVLYYTGKDLPNSELKEEVLSAENSEKVKELLKKKDPNIWRWVEIRQVQDEDPKAELIKYAEATKDPDYIKHVKEMKNMASINARLQWHRQKETKDGYNFEDPKKIQEVINKLEKDLKEGKYVDMNYLAGVKRALEMAKKERNMKDSFDMLKLSGITQDAYDPKKYEAPTTTDTYSVVHRDGDFKVVQTEEGFEVYYLGVYHDTFQTKGQALEFIKKSQKKG